MPLRFRMPKLNLNHLRQPQLSSASIAFEGGNNNRINQQQQDSIDNIENKIDYERKRVPFGELLPDKTGQLKKTTSLSVISHQKKQNWQDCLKVDFLFVVFQKIY